MTPFASLTLVPDGVTCRVLHVADAARGELAREGLLAGTVLTIVSRAPFGGPLVVQVGRARLALSADLAAQVRTEPLEAGGPA